MLNIEKYKDEIKAELEKFSNLGCVVNKLMGDKCDYPKCNDCYLKVLDWLLQEYKAPVLTEEGKAYLSNLLKLYGLGTCAFQFSLSEVVKNDTYKLSIADEHGIIINLAIRQDSEMQELFRKMQFDKVYAVKDLGI